MTGQIASCAVLSMGAVLMLHGCSEGGGNANSSPIFQLCRNNVCCNLYQGVSTCNVDGWTLGWTGSFAANRSDNNLHYTVTAPPVESGGQWTSSLQMSMISGSWYQCPFDCGNGDPLCDNHGQCALSVKVDLNESIKVRSLSASSESENVHSARPTHLDVQSATYQLCSGLRGGSDCCTSVAGATCTSSVVGALLSFDAGTAVFSQKGVDTVETYPYSLKLFQTDETNWQGSFTFSGMYEESCSGDCGNFLPFCQNSGQCSMKIFPSSTLNFPTVKIVSQVASGKPPPVIQTNDKEVRMGSQLVL